MSSTRLELIRSYLEEIENTKRAIVGLLHENSNNVPRSLIEHKNTVVNDHRVKVLLESIQSRSMDVFLLLKDKTG
jgi:hypothetical protein